MSGNGARSQLYLAEISISGGVAPPEMTAVDSTANEGDGTIDFPIELSEAYEIDATFDYVIESISATAGEDTTITGGSMTIPANSASEILRIPLTDDSIDESVEKLRVRFTSPYHLTLGTSEVIGTIIDNDVDPGISIEDGFKIVAEPVTSAAARLTLRLSEANNTSTVTAQLNLIPITATPEVDYVSPEITSVVFPPGATVTTVQVEILPDNEPETDETFIVQLINPTNAGIHAGTALITILDDDAFPLLAKSVEVSVDKTNDDITIEWDAIPERPYTILSSTDLIDWIPMPGGQGITSTSAEGRFTFKPESGARRFYRMTDALIP